jgi:signal transduction histidine kinase
MEEVVEKDVSSGEFNLKKFFFGKISRKLSTGFFIIGVVPLVVFGIILFSIIYSSANQVASNVEVGLEEISHDSMAEDVSLLVDIVEKQTQSYSVLFKSIMLNKEFYKVLNEADETGVISENNFYPAEKSSDWVELNKQFKEIYEVLEQNMDLIRLFHKNGYIVNGIALGEEDVSDYKGDKSWFDDVMNPNVVAKDSFYISPISIARRTGTSAIRYVAPIEENGDRLGLFVINFKANAITENIQKFSLVESGGAMLIDLSYENAEGDISPWPVILSKSVEEGSTYLINESEGAQAPIGKKDFDSFSGEISYEVENVLWHGHYRKVDFYDKEWYVVVSAPEEELFFLSSQIEEETLGIQSKVRIISLFLLILVVVFSIWSGKEISKKISKPIEKLSFLAKQIKEKNFKERVDIKTGDELEELGDVFSSNAEVLEKIEEEHKQLEKSKTEFLSITSHELRSPMTPMKAQLQMLLGDYFGKLNENQKEAIKIVEGNTTRLDNIIVDFLEISRIEAARLKFRFVKADLTKYIKRVIEEMQGFMPEKKIKLILSVDKLPIIEIDPDRVMQVLRNLLTNAIKFSPNNSSIEINVKLQQDSILFSVKDNGIGINEADQQKIFEPFYQSENMYQHKSGGTGLGLAIVRGIVESQNGKVLLESHKGKGTMFSFTFPLKPVLKIKPIKLLFSENKNIEEGLKNIFKIYLGPMGENEFERMKGLGGLDKEKLFIYANTLISKGVLEKRIGEMFKIDLAKVFGDVYNFEKVVTKKIKRWVEEF